MRLLTTMKRLLSFLLSVVFIHAQTAPLLAKTGGPSFDDSNNVDLVGTYSGVLNPDSSESGTPTLSGETVNALGIFSLGVPAVGPASGSFLIFSDGIVFSGTITAVGDPSSGSLRGVINASFEYTSAVFDANGDVVTDPVTFEPLSQDIQATVFGKLEAEVKQSDGFDPTNIASILNSFQRIEGTATMGQVFNVPPDALVLGDVVTYTVDGVKQSTDVNTGADLDTDTVIIGF
jgi:hypothetical protein